MAPDDMHVYAIQADGAFTPNSAAARASPYSAKNIVTFLTKLIPSSLPVLRRIQLGPKDGETLLITTPLPFQNPSLRSADITSLSPKDVWSMALIDRGNHPSTELWPFCSLELYHGTAPHERTAQKADVHPENFTLPFSADICALATSQIRMILSHVPMTRRPDVSDADQFKTTGRGSLLLAGNVHSTVAALMASAGLLIHASVPYGKYLFPATADPKALELAPSGSSAGLADGLAWSVMRGARDFADVMAVNSIVRSPNTLAKLPNVAIRETRMREGREEGKAIAFAFASGDGSVRTLHVDPDYRRRGLAKMVVRRLLDTGVFEPPAEGPLAADPEVLAEMEMAGNGGPLAFTGIAEGNVSSVRTFQAVGARWRWDVYWLVLDLSRSEAGNA
jgi:ribosomal protein S18 acetylase RimI-like enzyme